MFLFNFIIFDLVRRALIASSLLLILVSIYVFIASVVLMAALRKEHELKFRHWLRAMAAFIALRLAAVIFQSIANVTSLRHRPCPQTNLSIALGPLLWLSHCHASAVVGGRDRRHLRVAGGVLELPGAERHHPP